MKKKCFKCRTEKELNCFYKHPQMSDGRLGKCKDCTIKDVKDNRIDKKVYYDKFDKARYRNNIHRYFCSKYDGMRRRELGLAHGGAKGKGILDENIFLEWCYKDENYKKFISLYEIWKSSGYKKTMSPSIDRIDNSNGYLVWNLQWLSDKENTRKYMNETEKRITICGVEKTLTEISEEYGLKRELIKDRLYRGSKTEDIIKKHHLNKKI